MAGVPHDNSIRGSRAVEGRARTGTPGSPAHRRRTSGFSQRHHQRHTPTHVRRSTAADQHRAEAALGQAASTEAEAHCVGSGAQEDGGSTETAAGEGESAGPKGNRQNDWRQDAFWSGPNFPAAAAVRCSLRRCGLSRDICEALHRLCQLRIHFIRDGHDIRQQQAEVQRTQIFLQRPKQRYLEYS